MTTIERLRALAEADARLWARYGRGDYANDRDYIATNTAYQKATEPPTILALLDVAEAARALAAVHEALHRRGDPEWKGWECDERNALCAALARLDGAS